MIEKHYITPQALLEDSFRLGLEIYRSGFRPDFVVGVWRGGTPVAVAIQEILHLCDVESDHIAIRSTSYRGIATQDSTVRVSGLEYLLQHMSSRHSVLIVDDVFDTGRSLAAILEALQSRAGDCLAEDIRLAVPWYKPNNSRVNFEPNYYLHTTESWLVFPHELHGLSKEEIGCHKADIKQLLEHYGVW